jgi:hypothetical protein
MVSARRMIVQNESRVKNGEIRGSTGYKGRRKRRKRLPSLRLGVIQFP